MLTEICKSSKSRCIPYFKRKVRHEAAQKMREAPRSRLAGAGFNPPKAALVKSQGGERLGKVTAENRGR